jgi:hypothetical protein
MYANFNTDNPDVLPCNRNNCRCGNDENCMYYNNAENGHYNYFAVNGAGDKNSPFYQCPSVQYDVFNQEHVYDDKTLNIDNGELGAYNDLTPYGNIDNLKGFYGPAPISYMDKPTCSNHPNKAQMTPQAMDRDADYDKWDRYHKYHQMQLKDNTAQANMPPAPVQHGSFLPPIMVGQMNITPWLALFAAGGGVWYLQKSGRLSNQAAMIVAIAILLVFFLPLW